MLPAELVLAAVLPPASWTVSLCPGEMRYSPEDIDAVDVVDWELLEVGLDTISPSSVASRGRLVLLSMREIMGRRLLFWRCSCCSSSSSRTPSGGEELLVYLSPSATASAIELGIVTEVGVEGVDAQHNVPTTGIVEAFCYRAGLVGHMTCRIALAVAGRWIDVGESIGSNAQTEKRIKHPLYAPKAPVVCCCRRVEVTYSCLNSLKTIGSAFCLSQ